MRHEREQ
jgi:hypothetical protein